MDSATVLAPAVAAYLQKVLEIKQKAKFEFPAEFSLQLFQS
jgi:hypothetical protein